MTNYNERLDDILNTLGERHIMVEHRLIHIGMPEQNGKNIETRKAKQAILDWHNKQVEAVLDRLESKLVERRVDNAPYAPGKEYLVPEAAIEAERNKLKEQTNDQL